MRFALPLATFFFLVAACGPASSSDDSSHLTALVPVNLQLTNDTESLRMTTVHLLSSDVSVWRQSFFLLPGESFNAGAVYDGVPGESFVLRMATTTGSVDEPLVLSPSGAACAGHVTTQYPSVTCN